MRHQFWKVTPGGNPTILLKAEDIPSEQRASVANAVMSSQHIGGEQVGYVRLEGIPRLDMMGGEFCLNATRAFASVLDELGLLERNGAISSGLVEVSGVSEKVAVRVTHTENSLPFAEACLHFDELPAPEHISDGLCLVRVPGIAHIVQSGTPAPYNLEEGQLLDFCSHQRTELGLENEDAVGHLWLSSGKSQANSDAVSLTLDPVVWVRETKTLCFESACGSGTLACSLAEHAKSGATCFDIVQPSGMALAVRIEHSDSGFDVWVGGPSRITACGDTDLSGILRD